MKESSKETLKTYGEKPTPFLFTFDDTGVAESYYLGSEVRFSFIIVFSCNSFHYNKNNR